MEPVPPAEPTGSARAAVSSDPLQASIDAAGRREEDRARDGNRKPYETMRFFGIAPGLKVAELLTAGGYYAELLARAVGPGGHVYAQNNSYVSQKFAEPELSERLQQPDLGNVTHLVSELEDPKLPEGELDVVLLILGYHDTYWMRTDRAAMNAAVFAALKPGGVFGVIDHHSAPGARATQVVNLHRIDEKLVKREILDAGFQLDDESDLLRNADDDHTKTVFDRQVRGKTDQFMLRFRKPK